MFLQDSDSVFTNWLIDNCIEILLFPDAVRIYRIRWEGSRLPQADRTEVLHIKTAGVVSVTYTTIEKDGKADFYTIGAKGEADHVRKALDLIKDDAIMRGSSVGK